VSAGDLLANVERLAHDRPRAVTPAVPDLEAPDRPQWLGSATSEVEFWKQRALLAEAAVSALRRALARYRVRP
jgi:hypothetical protein